MSDAEAELRQLCDKYYGFCPNEYAADEDWLAAQIRKGTLIGLKIETLCGKIVAAYQGEVVAFGDNDTQMRVELSKKYEVHPGRFVLFLIHEHCLPKKAAALGCSLVNVVMVLILCAVVGIAAISSLGTKANGTFRKIGTLPDRTTAK